MSKQKFDLSNVGGQPKDWLERHLDYASEYSEWDDIKLVAAFVGVPLLFVLSVGGVLYSLLKFAGKI